MTSAEIRKLMRAKPTEAERYAEMRRERVARWTRELLEAWGVLDAPHD